MKGLLTAAGLFPHPPIMVPEIGGKETKKIQQTMDAVRKSMKLIMEIWRKKLLPLPGWSPKGTLIICHFHQGKPRR